MATATASPPAGQPGHTPVELTTDEFFRLIDSGVFDPHRRIYLHEGRLCEAMGKSPEHVGLANAFMLAVTRRLPEGWYISAENPLALTEKDAPLPDFTVVKGDLRDARRNRQHVRAADVGLVVEVAVTSLPKDLGQNRSNYALAMQGGGTYVVIDHPGQCLWVHEQPGPDPQDPGRGVWNTITQVRAGESARIVLGEHALAPIPWEDVFG
jgi:Uma2 family endonuclease